MKILSFFAALHSKKNFIYEPFSISLRRESAHRFCKAQSDKGLLLFIPLLQRFTYYG